MSEGLWDLPEGWAWTTLSELISYGPRNGYSGPIGEDGTLTLKLSATTTGELVLNASTTKNLAEVLPPDSQFFLEPGDLLIQRANSLNYLGASAIYDGPPDTYVYPDLMMRVRVADPTIRRLLWRWLSAPACRKYFRDAATGTAGNMPKINGRVVKAAAVPLPPTGEANLIVAHLDDLLARARRARDAVADVPAMLDQLRQSVLAAAFRGDLTAEWRQAQPDVEPAAVLLARVRAERRRRFEEANPKKKYVAPAPVDAEAEGLPELPAGWEWASLDELVDGIDAGKSPKAHGQPAQPGQFGVLKVSAVTWGEFNPRENKALYEGQVPPSHLTVRAGDLLISRANTVDLVGAVVLVNADYPALMLCDKTLRLRYLSGVDPVYLLHALRSKHVRATFEADATGTSDSMRNLSQRKILSAPVPLAPLREQAIIAAHLRRHLTIVASLHDETAAVAGDIAALERATLAKAFRGELLAEPAGSLGAEAPAIASRPALQQIAAR